jgi:hypothetical protein
MFVLSEDVDILSYVPYLGGVQAFGHSLGYGEGAGGVEVKEGANSVVGPIE